MSANRQAVITFAFTIAAAAVAAAILSRSAYADDITVDTTPFVSTMSRQQVNAQLKVPYAGGNPWSGSYNMFQAKSSVTSEQATGEYKRSRDEVNALTGEDSGSFYLKMSAGVPAKAGATMGGPAR